MTSVLREISKLRDGASMVIDHSNSNRYCVIVKEANGAKTAYYFTTPIYNISTRRAVDMKFHQKTGAAYGVGSNATITLSNNLRLENSEGQCLIRINRAQTKVTEREIHYGDDIVRPSTNGVIYMARLEGMFGFSFEIEVDKPFMEIRSNDRSFSLMREKFKPFLTVSAIGSIGGDGEVISPAKISYQKISDRIYAITVSGCSPLGRYAVFEINLYEQKLIQDTTVESFNPNVNNAFGGIAFIGNTTEFGEQWLYARPDLSKMPELADKSINYIVLHMPKHNRANIEISAYRVSARFCSFGSTWGNKISASTFVSDSKIHGRYQSLDLTALLSDSNQRYIVNSDGMILRAKSKGSGFSVVSTGDSYCFPQILEVNYK